MPNKKILYLTLKKRWFDEILAGTKKIEYREIKDYWTKRLLDKRESPKHFDFIIFKNGYGKDAPTMKVEFLGLKITNQYEILLGDVVLVNG